MASIRGKIKPSGTIIKFQLLDPVWWRNELYLPQTFASTTKGDGTFVLSIPPGRYKLILNALVREVLVPDANMIDLQTLMN